MYNFGKIFKNCRTYIFCTFTTDKTVMATILEQQIGNYFQGRSKLPKQKLVDYIKKDFPQWTENTINAYLSKLRKEGIVNTPSRGVYEFDSAPHFQPEISPALKTIFKKVRREFPYLTFCVWDTAWLHGFMLHQPFKQYKVVEVEKEGSEAVFNFLNENLKNVFYNPDEEIFDRYIQNQDEVLIVKNMVSESPLAEQNNIIIPTLEKLLVDMLIDTTLFSAQQDEIPFIMRNVQKKTTLNEPRMRRYAARRNREKEVNDLLSISSAK